MAENSSPHPLDVHLSKIDQFFADSLPVPTNSKNGLIYAFFPKIIPHSNARFDATALRTCFVASYVRKLFKIRGINFSIDSSSNGELFNAMKNDFGWCLETDGIDSKKVTDFEEIFTELDQDNEKSIGSEKLEKIDTKNTENGKNLERTFSIREASTVASLISDGTESKKNLIVVVPESSLEVWTRTKNLLEIWFDRSIRIATIPIGKVTFVGDWAKNLMDYFASRRNLIESGRHETETSAATRKSLTFAAITFELMVQPFKRSIVIDEFGQWARNGVFVSYNYARLCNILKKYERGARDGKYPSSKSIEKLDDGVKTKISQEMESLLDWFRDDREKEPGMDPNVKPGSIDEAILKILYQEENFKKRKLPSIYETKLNTFCLLQFFLLPKPSFTSSFESLFNKKKCLRNDMFLFSNQFSNFYSKRRVLTDAVPISGLNADALLVKIHVLERLKKLYEYWLDLFNIVPVDTM